MPPPPAPLLPPLPHGSSRSTVNNFLTPLTLLAKSPPPTFVELLPPLRALLADLAAAPPAAAELPVRGCLRAFLLSHLESDSRAARRTVGQHHIVQLAEALRLDFARYVAWLVGLGVDGAPAALASGALETGPDLRRDAEADARRAGEAREGRRAAERGGSLTGVVEPAPGRAADGGTRTPADAFRPFMDAGAGRDPAPAAVPRSATGTASPSAEGQALHGLSEDPERRNPWNVASDDGQPSSRHFENDAASSWFRELERAHVRRSSAQNSRVSRSQSILVSQSLGQYVPRTRARPRRRAANDVVESRRSALPARLENRMRLPREYRSDDRASRGGGTAEALLRPSYAGGAASEGEAGEREVLPVLRGNDSDSRLRVPAPASLDGEQNLASGQTVEMSSVSCRQSAAEGRTSTAHRRGVLEPSEADILRYGSARDSPAEISLDMAFDSSPPAVVRTLSTPLPHVSGIGGVRDDDSSAVQSQPTTSNLALGSQASVAATAQPSGAMTADELSPSVAFRGELLRPPLRGPRVATSSFRPGEILERGIDIGSEREGRAGGIARPRLQGMMRILGSRSPYSVAGIEVSQRTCVDSVLSRENEDPVGSEEGHAIAQDSAANEAGSSSLALASGEVSAANVGDALRASSEFEREAAQERQRHRTGSENDGGRPPHSAAMEDLGSNVHSSIDSDRQLRLLEGLSTPIASSSGHRIALPNGMSTRLDAAHRSPVSQARDSIRRETIGSGPQDACLPVVRGNESISAATGAPAGASAGDVERNTSEARIRARGASNQAGAQSDPPVRPTDVVPSDAVSEALAASLQRLRAQGVSSVVIEDMTRGDLASCIAAYIVRYDVRLAVEFADLCICFSEAVDRHGIIGDALVGPDRLEHASFVCILESALYLSRHVNCRLGYSALILNFARRIGMS